jgi:hypothetical protein
MEVHAMSIVDRLSPFRQIVRPRVMLPVFVAACLTYAIALYPWMMNWGSTQAERQLALPGDDIIPAPALQYTRAITIRAPADEVWQWLVQLGQDRAGFYSYDWLENLTGADIHNGSAIRAEWQPRAVGDPVYMAPPEILGVEPGEGTILRVIGLDPGRALLLAKRPEPYANVWATVLQPIDGQTTRLLVRERYADEPSFLNRAFYQPAHFVMQSHLMRGIKDRAEGHPTSAVLDVPARLGWIAAALALLGLFVAKGSRGWRWLLVPAVAALPALALGHDLNAALAAFLSAGITVSGGLRFGRRWWAPYLNVGTAVMLTLLLAPNAYLIFGWSFLVLVAAGGLGLVRAQHGELGGWIGGLAHRPA